MKRIIITGHLSRGRRHRRTSSLYELHKDLSMLLHKAGIGCLHTPHSLPQRKSVVEKLINMAGLPYRADQAERLEQSIVSVLKEFYDQESSQALQEGRSFVQGLSIQLPNAKHKESYQYEHTLACPNAIIAVTPEIDVPGLSVLYHAGRLRITGCVQSAGNYKLTLKFTLRVGHTTMDEIRLFPIMATADPRDLWKDIDTSLDIEYYKPDSDSTYVKGHSATVIAASKRGRSHAHEGKPRDDHFAAAYDESTGWYTLCVADGAGSAPYSREGSRIACDTALATAKQLLSKEEHTLEQNLISWSKDSANEELKRQAHIGAYKLLGAVALEASRAIAAEAKAKAREDKAYATTFLLTLCKHTDRGWLIASFWIGDGAIALYDKAQDSVKVMGTPDGGAYAGQTCFLTMPSIFDDAINRIRVAVVPEFTALFLLSDGITDPKFETDANLHNVDYWHTLWDELSHLYEGVPEEDKSTKLLEWMDFWSQGNHDDRTLLMLF